MIKYKVYYSVEIILMRSVKQKKKLYSPSSYEPLHFYSVTDRSNFEDHFLQKLEGTIPHLIVILPWYRLK